MYNEPRHVVSIFKDYLIFDDFSEYLKRPYTNAESVDRLPKVFQFYSSYSKLFPSFVGMGAAECKYMFKNIERKQKLIDERLNKNEDNTQNLMSSFTMFNSQFVRELNATNNKSMTQLMDNEQKQVTNQNIVAIQYLKN